MITATIVIICILTVLLILIVLVQNSKGGGLTGEFGGLGSNQLMGVKKTTDLLEQITWGLGIAIMVLSLSTYIMVDRTQLGGINSANVDRAQTQTLPGAAAPTPGATPNQAVPSQSPGATPTPGTPTPVPTPQK
ncbi:preprotein translocase subunit SecG [Spirosoma flavum]|uniref:Protein-export membrane protein SecG n=1 Tax=Spirosoma flavum TaxID=2048557 RepID=A0ABW6AFX2_9BACT